MGLKANNPYASDELKQEFMEIMQNGTEEMQEAMLSSLYGFELDSSMNEVNETYGSVLDEGTSVGEPTFSLVRFSGPRGAMIEDMDGINKLMLSGKYEVEDIAVERVVDDYAVRNVGTYLGLSTEEYAAIPRRFRVITVRYIGD